MEDTDLESCLHLDLDQGGHEAHDFASVIVSNTFLFSPHWCASGSELRENYGTLVARKKGSFSHVHGPVLAPTDCLFAPNLSPTARTLGNVNSLFSGKRGNSRTRERPLPES